MILRLALPSIYFNPCLDPSFMAFWAIVAAVLIFIFADEGEAEGSGDLLPEVGG